MSPAIIILSSDDDEPTTTKTSSKTPNIRKRHSAASPAPSISHDISMNSTMLSPTNDTSRTAPPSTQKSRIASKKYLPLKYQRKILKEISNTETPNAMFIGDKGLGLQENILVAFLRHYALEKGQLVLVLNATTRQSEFIELEVNQGAFTKPRNGTEGNKLEARVRNVKSLTSQERRREYCAGRVIFIASNVLVMDFLQSNAPAQAISGIIILNAHEVSDLSYEAMAIRLYREKNQSGFVKALTDSPVGALRAIGRTKRLSVADASITKNVDKIMALLCLNHIYLWPSFAETVRESMRGDPTLYELEIPMTARMKRIQQEILKLITIILNDVSKLHPDLDFGDERTTTFLLNLEKIIKTQLKPQWNRIDRHTKHLIEDLQQLRELVLFLTQYDAVVYHHYLQTMRTAGTDRVTGVPRSHWVITDEAGVVFECARQRVYTQTTQKKKKKQKTMTQIAANEGTRTEEQTDIKLQLELLPKWTELENVLAEIQSILKKDSNSREDFSNRVLIVTKTEKSMSQIRNMLLKNPKTYLKQTAKRLVRVSTRENIKQLFGKRKSTGASGEDTTTAATTSTTAPNGTKRGVKRKSPGKKKLGVETEEDLQSMKSLLGDGTTDTTGIDLGLDESALYLDDNASWQFIGPADVSPKELPEREEAQFNEYFGLFDKTLLGESISTPETPVLDLTFSTSYNAFHMLNILRPSFVVMYEVDLEFSRRVEVYHAENPGVPLHLYLLRYVESAEEELYVAECSRTRAAFVELIKSSPKLLSVSKSLATLISENRPQLEDEIQRDSRVAGGRIEQLKRGKIIVDTREFRSMLPIRLDHMGVEVIPKQLSVGDYIITNQICVERKAIPDLIQSLSSGRLLNQADNMTKNYPMAALLIQFENHEPFCLSDEYQEISLSTPTAKLVLLTIQFPHLKVFWSRSSADSAELFLELKKNAPEPDENVIEESDGNENEKEKSEKAVKMLMQLPGITDSNVHKVKNRVTNMQELVQLSREEMEELLGKQNGERLYDFINQ